MEKVKKTKLKQGTLIWEQARQTRIGSSEVFDIVRYYASDEELQNCGISPYDFWEEKPYTTAWALYHKMLNDGIYRSEELAPELAEYGHAVEPYGLYVLRKNRVKSIKPAPVYCSDKLIVSLDSEGIAEDIDIRPFDYGTGKPVRGQTFVCEQKSMNPVVIKNGLPFKYIIQAQHQLTQINADFYILQLMVLDEDTPFIRGKICQMSRQVRRKYLDEHLTVTNIYFANNEALGQLIKVCLERFFEAVSNYTEPTPYLPHDKPGNIIQSIRINSYYNSELTFELELDNYIKAKADEDRAKEVRLEELQKIIEIAKEFNVSKFISENGIAAAFSKDGKFLLKAPKGGAK